MSNIDLACYIISAILFLLAGLEVSFGPPSAKWPLHWEWFAFMALVISMIV